MLVPLLQEKFNDNNPLIKTNKIFENFYSEEFPSLESELSDTTNQNDSTSQLQTLIRV